MSRLSEINEAYDTVMDLTEGTFRDKALTNLMALMKAEFKIPENENEEWEQQNTAVMALYRKMADSRCL